MTSTYPRHLGVAAAPARFGALTQLVFAVLIGTVSTLARDLEPDFVPRPIVLVAIFALPGVVGLVATQRRRGSVLLGAALASLLGAGIAFSGVTLIFVLPAALMLVGASAMFDREAASPGGVAIAGAHFAITVVLLLGAGGSGLLVTDERCWTWRETPSGVVMEPAPLSTGEMAVPESAVGSGCSTGTISARGVGLGALLGAGAIAVAAWPAGRRREVG